MDDKGNWATPEIAIEVAERNDAMLIRNINQRVKSDDRVVHVGDFLNRGGVKGVMGLRNNPDDYLDKLNGRWLLLSGNHDKNNKVKNDANHAILNVGPYQVFVSHYPIENTHIFAPKLVDYVLHCTDFQINGHVHQSWKYKWHIHGHGKYLMYNVGVDVRRYMPITTDEIIRDVMGIFKNKEM